MRLSTSLLLLSPLLASLVSAGCHKQSKGHRRHHHKHQKVIKHSSQAASASTHFSKVAGDPTAVLAGKQHTSTPTSSSAASSSAAAQPSNGGTPSSHASSSKPTSTPSAPSSGSWGLKGHAKNNIFVGMLPDDGSGGGTAQSMAQIDSSLGITSAAQGWYAQAHSGTLFDGSQLVGRMDQIVASGALFQPAVMPVGGWWGLGPEGSSNGGNQQAVAICSVMKQFTDKGLTVWLRFAHEVNWYQSDGTYQGNANDFKRGWASVSAACKIIAPDVKMWFTPNVADLNSYKAYYPDDPSTVDLIGIDYYPQANSLNFVETMKPFHDLYASETTKFAIGETGLASGASIGDRLAWLQDATSAATASAMPHYMALSWFNYMKGYDFRIGAIQGDSIVAAYLKN